MRLEWLFVVALVLYSAAIWSHKLKKRLAIWMVTIFGIGLFADVSGTIFLCATVSQSWSLTLHAISGFVSLLIMALHFFWALSALVAAGKFGGSFNRFSIYAWGLWLVAFCSGIPLS